MYEPEPGDIVTTNEFGFNDVIGVVLSVNKSMVDVVVDRWTFFGGKLNTYTFPKTELSLYTDSMRMKEEIHMIKIKFASNGYSVFDTNTNETTVFQSKESDSREHVQDMLYHLVDVLGESGSRYDKERIAVTIEPGDKYEEETKV